MNKLQINRDEYKQEKEYREKRLKEFNEAIQEKLEVLSRHIICELVEERERQGMTQKEVADMIGIIPYNLARFETGVRIPTLVMLEKYASALDMHMEIQLSANKGEK